ncbi:MULTISPECIES: hypothetical protein [unclassified Dehalobacter]|uniref:tetratricopeptide repeat protein n=1 Tax=unclassified Dehalobacter TaxID=2635733 RepID=UPI00028AA536|nr:MULTISPECIES: hypothetical protein [unclassified Dehalobacter]AFV02983.1 hypothetical protein DHBDCA_p1957 [Dehalobacter sp. DCA]AFV05970.1 hypothetical protein DCF50_p1968 [Dehalobacter sp. CF]
MSIELSNKVGETVLFANSRSDLDPKILLDLHKELNIPLVILIDNISDRIGKTNKLLSFFKNNGARILIIGASRSSDWNLLSQESILAKHKEYPMGKLSDFEIPAILNKLKINNCLGTLTGIDELEQINIFKSYSERELIVALREITTGKKFDDIIANEYFSIKSSLAQQAYKYICIVNQYRYRIPQSLLLRIIGVDLSQVQEILFKFTEGIISYEETKDKDDYLISARHSVIASVIVRLFCKNDVEKYEFLESIVKAAIPSNPLEKSLVKKLYHHSTVSSFFSSNDVGVQSYDLLSGQLPGDSFLLQQKALFLSGIGRFDDAKATIDSALEMNPTSQIFKNTQGTIYLKESLNEIDFTKSSYLRDKGKDILLGAIRKSSRSYYKTSPYHYHSLISHLINWYKKFTPGSGESEQLLEEIQKLMEEATREQPNDSAILVEAGRLQEILVNNPVAKGYFNRALELNPRNMSARFLLSRILMAEKEFNHAYKICSEGVLLKEDEILLNRLRFELMHKLNIDFETIKSEYAKYTQTVPEDIFIKLCYAAYLYINNDDQCTDIFIELRNNPTLNHKEKHETMRVERIMNIHYLRESGYVIASTPAGYLCRTERFDTRTTFYCHRRFVNNVHENTRIESVTRFSCQGPLSKVARVIR